MLNRVFAPKYLSLAVVSVFVHSGVAFAVETDSEKQLGEMVIKADKPAVPANLPSTTEGVTAKQIEESINAVTTGSVLQYLPSVHVRERYIGDRNGILVMRANSSVSSAQTIVYADNLLLSNFLGNTFAYPPRWGMVAPEEIERVDVIYGPFSALYPGNSMGGVVHMTTRMPEKFEAHAKVDGFTERFKLYGTDKSFSGTHGSASVGNKFGDWSMWMSADHLDNHGHPMTFGNATAKSGAAAAAGQFTVVSNTNIIRDTDTTGKPRIIVSSLGMDHTVQDNGKLKLAYDFSPSVRATYTLGIWQNKSETTVDSYLRDAAGNTIYNTGGSTVSFGALRYVRIDGKDYTVSSAVPSYSESEHWMHGLSLKSNTRSYWDWEAVASFYNQNMEVSRQAIPTNGYDSGVGAVRPGGQLTVGDGTGWRNLDLRGEWRPDGSLKSAHQISFGYHYDRYVLSSVTYGTSTSPISDWRSSTSGTLSTNSYGKTETQALYLQDAWRFAQDWKLTGGGRVEHWKAFDGSNYNAANAAAYRQLNYENRSYTNFSPKASLSLQASIDWALRASVAKAVRYPTVAEMFQTYTDASGAKVNDPNLRPEQVTSADLTAERALEDGLWRVSVFQEDKRDGLISQTDTANITSIQNVDKIRSLGIETALQVSDFGIRGLDLSGSMTAVNSKIIRNDKNPSVVGKDQPRIPDFRATLVATYHASDNLSYSVSARYSGRQWASLAYTDTNPNVYGTPGVSSYTVVDAKLLYKVAKQWSASAGINNVGDYKYYVQPNPYPQRTFFASVKFDY